MESKLNLKTNFSHHNKLPAYHRGVEASKRIDSSIYESEANLSKNWWRQEWERRKKKMEEKSLRVLRERIRHMRTRRRRYRARIDRGWWRRRDSSSASRRLKIRQRRRQFPSSFSLSVSVNKSPPSTGSSIFKSVMFHHRIISGSARRRKGRESRRDQILIFFLFRFRFFF